MDMHMDGHVHVHNGGTVHTHAEPEDPICYVAAEMLDELRAEALALPVVRPAAT